MQGLEEREHGKYSSSPTHSKCLINNRHDMLGNQSTLTNLHSTMRAHWKELAGACAAENTWTTLPWLTITIISKASSSRDFVTNCKRVRRKYFESTKYNFYAHINKKKSLYINFIRSEGKEVGVNKNNPFVWLWRQLKRSACLACVRPWEESQAPQINKQTYLLTAPSEFCLPWEEWDKD